MPIWAPRRCECMNDRPINRMLGTRKAANRWESVADIDPKLTPDKCFLPHAITELAERWEKT